MSPTLAFPPPFRSRDLPPYGHADWHRLQPALLRRSLALSSGLALLAGLVLGYVLQHAHLTPPPPPITIIKVGPDMTPPPPIIDPHPGIPAPTPVNPNAGILVPKPDVPEVPIEDPIPPTTGLTDPKGILGGATGENSNTTTVLQAPERPDPNAFVPLDEAPREVYAPRPEYPEIARQAQMQGEVLLRVLVSKEGKVQELILVKSSRVFDDAAESAIRQWRFRPAIMGHQPVAAWVTIPVRFVLNE